MWHIQATLDDQPLADDDKILLENGINVGFSCTFENGLCSGWLSSKERVTGFENDCKYFSLCTILTFGLRMAEKLTVSI